MRRATAVLTLTAVLVVVGAGLAAGAGASPGPFRRAYVPRGMAVYEWHQAGELPDAEVARRLRLLRPLNVRSATTWTRPSWPRGPRAARPC